MQCCFHSEGGGWRTHFNIGEGGRGASDNVVWIMDFMASTSCGDAIFLPPTVQIWRWSLYTNSSLFGVGLAGSHVGGLAKEFVMVAVSLN
jgi:hypothetical protein